jgi:hypothetical protein
MLHVGDVDLAVAVHVSRERSQNSRRARKREGPQEQDVERCEGSLVHGDSPVVKGLVVVVGSRFPWGQLKARPLARASGGRQASRRAASSDVVVVAGASARFTGVRGACVVVITVHDGAVADARTRGGVAELVAVAEVSVIAGEGAKVVDA